VRSTHARHAKPSSWTLPRPCVLALLSLLLILFSYPLVCSFEYRYARYTTIATLLGVQVKYLKFFSLFFADDVFVYCLLLIFGLSLLCLGYTYPRTN